MGMLKITTNMSELSFDFKSCRDNIYFKSLFCLLCLGYSVLQTSVNLDTDVLIIFHYTFVLENCMMSLIWMDLEKNLKKKLQTSIILITLAPGSLVVAASKGQQRTQLSSDMVGPVGTVGVPEAKLRLLNNTQVTLRNGANIILK